MKQIKIQHTPLLLICLWIMLSLNTISGQDKAHMDAEKEAINNVIATLFEGMKEGDSSKVHSVFSDDVRMLTTYTNKKGEAVMKEGSLQRPDFVTGTPELNFK